MSRLPVHFRTVAQFYFLAVQIFTGYSLYQAVHSLPVIGVAAFQYRYPSVEAFLPISALTGFKYWLFTHEFDPVHPAGLTVLVLAVVSAFLLKRGFCSHICPIGTLAEYLYKGRTFFCKNRLHLPRLLAAFMQLPKYMLLFFFCAVIFIGMTPQDASSFVHSPYNAIAEIKMLYFFLSPSALTVEILAVIIVLSLVIQNFWCRFLCPYGALLSLFSLVSPLAVTRNPRLCNSCCACDENCPAQLTVSKTARIASPECTLCLNCIHACPAKALSIRSNPGGHVLGPWQYSLLLTGLFAAGILAARLTGHWQSALLAPYWLHYAPMTGIIFH